MKIDFIESGSPDCPLLRIYGNEPGSAALLISVFDQLASGHTNEVAIHSLPDIESVNGCKLFARLHHEDIGIRKCSEKNTLECLLSSESWTRISGLLEPFTEPKADVRYQWLDETSDISLLISSSEYGEW
ncbi:hypothetical protein KP001_01385 [Geomonas subterranea]|uniref:Uncharacterized protein n=1 Tax=Geomonas subterranea TaxID=2847989 RepID=A0ABX8LGX4_9BACT|nr:hypothetical protein [Geomonas subterranea]QXE91222.1 hypothetical protein KP001_01385 [Geomonas subterranea]QXM10691.1 hypothetical protein KP002_06105 [Geomonas subterranea]